MLSANPTPQRDAPCLGMFEATQAFRVSNAAGNEIVFCKRIICGVATMNSSETQAV